MMMPVLLTDATVERLVDPLALSDAIERLILRGGTVEAERRAIRLGDTWFAPMTAGGYRLITVKMVGVYPGNPERGLPLVRALTVVYSAETGDPLLVYEANAATAVRTAAASLLAARILGARRGGVLGIIGAGVQARAHGEAFQAAFKPERVLVASRSGSSAARLAREKGWDASSIEEIHREATLIVAATNSRTPVVRGALLNEGTIVVSVGAPAPVRELDDELKRRARCLLVDTGNATVESPDAQGWPELVTLEDAVRTGRACQDSSVRVYKSVGRPLFDHAVSLYLAGRLGLTRA
ncbi:MAG: NAD(P)-binding domain-containing protein [Desulfurococcales archaeon]|nr:NAD(P)-binding domain-containing protein [Desulfurococcales archaeon]